MRQKEGFNKYIEAFEKKLDLVKAEEISTEIYCRKYLTHLLQHKKYYLAIYADVLDKLVLHSAKNTLEIQLIDYGAGNGLLGIFAKFCGFKKVFLNDVDPKFLSASEKLARQLKIEIDGFIPGDIETVRENFKNEIPDAIIGTDVIEHIYSLEKFLETLKKINPEIISVFTTGSNPENYFKVRALKKLQQKDELEGGTPNDHILFGETSLEPFLKIRETIIRKNFTDIPETKIPDLAKSTRGLIEQDILEVVDQYQVSGNLPVITVQGTNTCNPLNGSWTERILPLETYILFYADAGFTCKFYPGFYNDYERGIGSIVKKLLNAFITTMGEKISPYIVIVGSKK